MRIVFIGASDLGYRCCEHLIESGNQVAGIITGAREFRISYAGERRVTNVLHRDFAELGRIHDIPVRVVERMADAREPILSWSPELILVIGWYHMVPASIRGLATRGCLGIHASLLPLYRGGAPLVWAMIQGERTTGVTLFHLADGVDDGDIVEQQSFPIDEHDTIREVVQKATDASIELLRVAVPALAAGTARRVAQDHSSATTFPQRSPEDGLINWEWESARLRNFIRAQTRPYPGAFTVLHGKRVTIWDATIADT